MKEPIPMHLPLNEVLENVTAFSDKCHATQMRKYSPERYIVHPVRVMDICREFTNDVAVLAAALLHDVLEDTPVSKEDIHQFLLPLMNHEEVNKTINLVEELTDEFVKSKYPHWNRRKRKEKERERMQYTSAEAQNIKYADIIDNAIDITRNDPVFAQKFLFECRALLRIMTRGNKDLYNRAMGTIDNCINEIREVY